MDGAAVAVPITASSFTSSSSGELQPRFTVIPDKSAPLPNGTLADILRPKQTGIGRAGLQALIYAQ